MTETTEDQGAIVKRSVLLSGHRTSVSLERVFWDALKQIAIARGTSINQLIAHIDSGRKGNLSSALRVFVLEVLRADGGGQLTHKG